MEEMLKCAEIIYQICERKRDHAPGKKAIQKLLYLMEQKGVRLKLNYRIHYFGPYSERLDDLLHLYESYHMIRIDTSGPTHYITAGEKPEKCRELTKREKAAVEEVLDKFLEHSALELEAITTLDYAAKNLLPETAGPDEVIREVIKIKGKKFSREVLKKDWEILKKEGYCA